MDTYKKHFDEFKALNESVFKFRRKRRIKLLIKIAILETVFILFAVAGYSVSPVRAIIFSSVCGIVLPFLMFDPQECFRRPFIGKIIGTKYMMRYVFPKGVLAGGTNFHGHAKFTLESFVRFTVRDENGKKHHFTLKQHYGNVYKIGDKVMLISGIDYPICYTKRKHAVCLECGAMFIPHKETCDALWCGALLPIIPEEKENEYDYGTYEI